MSELMNQLGQQGKRAARQLAQLTTAEKTSICSN